jgi:ubiquinone/menaquinone biosynthesis C-methylase UbiE
VHPGIYTSQIQRDARENLNILDFGCGYGYVAMQLAISAVPGIRVYACDTDEECLDVLWGRIAHRVVKNLTAFHLPNYSQISLPGWLPAMDYVICSFSIAALEHPDIGLPQLARQMAGGTQFLFVEWDPEKTHPFIDIYFPPARRITPADFKQLIEMSGLKLQQEEIGKQPYYVLRAMKV